MTVSYQVFGQVELQDGRRDALILNAWGSNEIPFSYNQSDVDLRQSTHLEVAVDKWRIQKSWSFVQRASHRPRIRSELLREESLERALNFELSAVANKLEFSPVIAVFTSMDGENILPVDFDLFKAFVLAFAESVCGEIFSDGERISKAKLTSSTDFSRIHQLLQARTDGS